MSHIFLTPRQLHAAKLMLSGRMAEMTHFDFVAWDEFKAIIRTAPVDLPEDLPSGEPTIGEIHASGMEAR